MQSPIARACNLLQAPPWNISRLGRQNEISQLLWIPFESALRERAAPRTKRVFDPRQYRRNLRHVHRGKDEVTPAESASSCRVRNQESALCSQCDGLAETLEDGWRL